MKSLLSRFQKKTHFFEVRDEWLQFSEDTPQQDKLLKILEEKEFKKLSVKNEEITEVKVGITFYKVNGVRIGEKEETGEIFKEIDELETLYSKQLQAVSQKSGVPRSEIVDILNGTGNIAALMQLTLDQLALNLSEETETEEDNSKTDKQKEEERQQKLKAKLELEQQLIETKAKLRTAKKESKDDIKENIKDLEIYLPELNEIYRKLAETRDKFFKALIVVFLNGDRCVVNKQNPNNDPGFTIEDIEALHPEFQSSLYEDFLLREMSQWQKPIDQTKAETNGNNGNGKVIEEEKKEELSKT